MVAKNIAMNQMVSERRYRLRGRFARCGEAGFTLLEVAVASMILIFALASTIAMAGRGFRYIEDMRRAAKGSQILQREMENLRLMSWAQLQSLPATFTDPSNTTGIYSGTINTQSYLTYGSTTSVMEVTLTVSWQNQTASTVSNSLTSLFSNGGLNQYVD